MESQILKGLNQAQREAVVNYDSPSLIIAGAGSGKTRVLTSRIAYMIEQGVAPYNILALTFTNKAAEQMRERIAQMLPDGRHRYIRMGTFHSVFSRILRDNADRIGFPQSFTIYEPSDCKNLLKTIVRELNLDDTKYKPAMLASRISYAKNCLVTPGAYLANASFGAEDRRMQIPEFGNIYNIYCARCKRNGAMDFDDLLLQTNILLRDCPDVTARYQEQFKYILVDEYQDTNYAQYVIIRRLSQLHSKVCVVGDDAQSIYSFRGAKIENILSFKKDFPDAMIFKLEQNYRSTRTIVEAANSVIERNSKRMEKKCFSEGDMGEKIRVLRAYTDREEAEMVVSDLRDKVRAAGDEWAEAAILYRTNNQSQALEDALRRKGIPYRIYKGNSFYDHKEIKDLLAYIRLVINPRDDEAFKRIVNYPARGIGDTTVERIALLAKARNLSMWEAVDALMTQLDRLGADDTLVLAGSIPASMPDDIYQKIMERLDGRDVRIVVDATKDLLLNVLGHHPFLIKPNNHELGDIFGVKLSEREEVVPYAKKLQEKGAVNVLVSMAGKGAVLLAEDGSVYAAEAPKGTLKNGVGAGDSMVAGFLAGYGESGDYEHAFRMGLAAGSASAFSEQLATKDEIKKVYETCKITKIG